MGKSNKWTSISMIRIDTQEEYDLCKSNGFEPLIDERFDLDINLRISIQNELFGGSPLSQRNIPRGNVKFYRWCWDRLPHICEECDYGGELFPYNSKFVSHILSRKQAPEMRWDGRNINILCIGHHAQWEREPETMKIFAHNQKTIEKLKSEYNGTI
jgi:hypothetical protein